MRDALQLRATLAPPLGANGHNRERGRSPLRDGPDRRAAGGVSRPRGSARGSPPLRGAGGSADLDRGARVAHRAAPDARDGAAFDSVGWVEDVGEYLGPVTNALLDDTQVWLSTYNGQVGR